MATCKSRSWKGHETTISGLRGLGQNIFGFRVFRLGVESLESGMHVSVYVTIEALMYTKVYRLAGVLF